jgi:hypothetical protein
MYIRPQNTDLMRTKEAFKLAFGDIKGEICDVGSVRGLSRQGEIFSRRRKRSIGYIERESVQITRLIMRTYAATKKSHPFFQTDHQVETYHHPFSSTLGEVR